MSRSSPGQRCISSSDAIQSNALPCGVAESARLDMDTTPSSSSNSSYRASSLRLQIGVGAKVGVMIGIGGEDSGEVDGDGSAIPSSMVGGFVEGDGGDAVVVVVDGLGIDAVSSLLMWFASSLLELLFVMLTLPPMRRRKKDSVSEISAMCPKASSMTFDSSVVVLSWET